MKSSILFERRRHRRWDSISVHFCFLLCFFFWFVYRTSSPAAGVTKLPPTIIKLTQHAIFSTFNAMGDSRHPKCSSEVSDWFHSFSKEDSQRGAFIWSDSLFIIHSILKFCAGKERLTLQWIELSDEEMTESIVESVSQSVSLFSFAFMAYQSDVSNKSPWLEVSSF